MAGVLKALERLHSAVSSGALSALCREHGVDLLVLFGSAVHSPDPGDIDLAVTRFSGRDAPPHPGGAPNCGPHVMHEAYSQEVSSAGYWPGGEGEGIFYSYAYPEPPGFRSQSPGLIGRWDDELEEFVLPYTAVRTADDPDAVLLDFLERTYIAAADTGDWDRRTFER